MSVIKTIKAATTTGLTTNQGFNALAALVGIMEFGRPYIPTTRMEAYTYFCTVVLMVVMWRIKGSSPVDGVGAETKAPETDEEILKAGRE